MKVEFPNEDEAFELTEAQKQELDRRLEFAKNNPNHCRTWDEIKAEFMRSCGNKTYPVKM